MELPINQILQGDCLDRIEKEKKLNDTVELLIKTRDQLIQKDKMAALAKHKGSKEISQSKTITL